MRKSLAALLFVLTAAVYLLAAHATFKPEIDPIWPDESAAPADCGANAQPLPQGMTRVYIALRNGQDGSGNSIADARDGSTVTAFDTILRCYSEGCTGQQNSGKPVAKTENLIVCLDEGTFSTMGSYDQIIAVPHTTANGFTIGKGWRIHGAGKGKTTVKLSAYLPITDPKDPRNFPVDTGIGLVLGTNSDAASGIEISDLTVDCNYPELKSRSRQHGVRALSLDAIHLRSDEGGHWIHDVNVINAAAEIGEISPRYEAFPVQIASVQLSKPEQNRGNVIERVYMSRHFGNVCTAIAVANATAEVRGNLVDGYQIGYGGWDLHDTVFHDNTAVNTEYGFNIDSLANSGVRIERNKILNPRKYGIVIGGEGTFAGFKFLNNVIQLDKPGTFGFVFNGNVTGAVISGNKILVEFFSPGYTAFRNYSASKKAGPNRDNLYQSNQITSGMTVAFEGPSQKSQNCFYDNRDEHGKPRKDLPDNHKGPCVPTDPQK
ncbi:MAG TPA: right-handed parallel beta-helix repeat-containing protein [Verrucomicrobiae bacterium]|nr:right-handed parallel beta-helix repeat-containing protein [Verrucomicrobiae bacterium]